MKLEMVWRILPRRIREKISESDLEQVQEIRLRCGQPVGLKKAEGGLQVLEERITASDIRETVSLLSAYSLYAFEEELRDYVPKNQDAKQKNRLVEEKRSLENAITKLKREIENIDIDIETIGKREFNENETQKSFEKTKNNYVRIKKPDFLLPEVGELFETRDTFYLEISDDRDLERANELANRYTGRNYKVVAKV